MPAKIFFDAVTRQIPPEQTGMLSFRVPILPETGDATIEPNAVSVRYFHAMNLPLIAGRTLSEDDGLGKCRVRVINQEAASRQPHGSESPNPRRRQPCSRR